MTDAPRTNRRFSLPRKKRLTSSTQIRRIITAGVSAADGLLKLRMAQNRCRYPRLAISTPKSCGNAVFRNRLKRLIREVFRLNQPRIPPNFDYFFMISPRLSKNLSKGQKKQPDYTRVEASCLALVEACVRKIDKKG